MDLHSNEYEIFCCAVLVLIIIQTNPPSSPMDARIYSTIPERQVDSIDLPDMWSSIHHRSLLTFLNPIRICESS